MTTMNLYNSQYFRCLMCGLVASCLLALSPANAQQRQVAGSMTFTSDRDALRQGIGAYRAGRYDIAQRALEFAAKSGNLRAKLELAELLDDEDNRNRNRGRAFDLIEDILSSNENIDVRYNRPRVRLIARAAIKYALMLRDGVPERQVKPSLELAVDNLEYAAGTLQNKKAQFELYRLYLTGAMGDALRRRGLKWLHRAARNNYPPAMALLADMLWKGENVRQNRRRALDLIRRARLRVSPRDRLWVEDLHHEIYCGSSAEDRARVAGFSQTRRDGTNALSSDGFGNVSIARACDDQGTFDRSNSDNWGVWRELERGVDYDDAGRRYQPEVIKPDSKSGQLQAEKPLPDFNTGSTIFSAPRSKRPPRSLGFN